MLPQLVIFDLDGTLTESRMPMDDEMGSLLQQLLEATSVAIISGGTLERLKTQFLDVLNRRPANTNNLYLAPLSGSALYTFTNNEWAPVYTEVLTQKERTKIKNAFSRAFKDAHFTPEPNPVGNLIDDRGGQITFAGLGCDAPIEQKKKWDPDRKKRTALVCALKHYLPEFEITIGGTTSIDISRGGIDKAYGIGKLSEYLSIPREQILFIGDAIVEGGNDYAVTGTGVATQLVEGPEDTKKYVHELLSHPR